MFLCLSIDAVVDHILEGHPPSLLPLTFVVVTLAVVTDIMFLSCVHSFQVFGGRNGGVIAKRVKLLKVYLNRLTACR